MSLRIQKFYYTGSTVQWTCPRTVTHVLIFAIGGGGGGGGGLSGNNTTTLSPGGGAGGGGAIEVERWVPVIPNRVYNIAVGARGLGGTAGNPGANGSPTYFIDSVTLNDIVVAQGAQGGEAGKNGAIAFGGLPVAPHSSSWTPTTLAYSGLGLIYPGMGGWGGARGTAPTTSWPGMLSIKGGSHISGQSMPDQPGNSNYPNVAGFCNGGALAAASGSYAGGGFGGGGGAATICFQDTTGGALDNNGGASGSGGAGNSGGFGFSGSGGGSSFLRPIGMGGAGGGGGGCGSGGGGTGGEGTCGGHGRLVIIYL